MGEEQRPLGATWAAMIDEVITGMRDWRTAHPHATFTEIEAAIDERLHGLRARMIEEAALAQRAAATAECTAGACALCGGPLRPRGQHERPVRVHGDQRVRLRRPYLVCTRCGRGAFPPGRRVGAAAQPAVTATGGGSGTAEHLDAF